MSIKDGKLVDAVLDDYITTLATTPPESGRFYMPYKWMQAVLLELRQHRDKAASAPVTGDAAQIALNKINHIRNSIVGMQTINWSEHIYPLVAALDEAGMVGMDYPEGRKYFGTLLERTNAAEAKSDAIKGVLEAVKEWREYAADEQGSVARLASLGNKVLVAWDAYTTTLRGPQS